MPVTDIGIEQFTDEDRAYSGCRFSEAGGPTARGFAAFCIRMASA